MIGRRPWQHLDLHSLEPGAQQHPPPLLWRSAPGRFALDHASSIATQYGLQHQLRSINNIRNSKEFA
ncbi:MULTISPECIES: hypothetical protein [Streptacidiphilus]|uniref:Uncharacterized protein n=1 Tax=Streptacidiphilus cavernicola TaxID=3342716 RepID=A0ABV6UV28_9ACTN|nr:hypothetical protein [Streptacidiphilus jeojiense]